VVITRFGLILGRHGGVLGQLVPLFRRLMGSRLGDGRQWFSWVHAADLARMFLLILEREDLAGPFNFTSPGPVRNSELTKTLAQAVSRPVILPFAPGFMLRLVLGEFAEVILQGQRVVPRRLSEAGFSLRVPYTGGGPAGRCGLHRVGRTIPSWGWGLPERLPRGRGDRSQSVCAASLCVFTTARYGRFRYFSW
jgi:hypothetical protein